jgi:protein disulfide-isomerase A6
MLNETDVRCSSRRLATILEKRSLASSKLDEIKVKANIIAAFIEHRDAKEEDVGVKRNPAEL